jgi:hypothetical protein
VTFSAATDFVDSISSNDLVEVREVRFAVCDEISKFEGSVTVDRARSTLPQETVRGTVSKLARAKYDNKGREHLIPAWWANCLTIIFVFP